MYDLTIFIVIHSFIYFSIYSNKLKFYIHTKPLVNIYSSSLQVYQHLEASVPSTDE